MVNYVKQPELTINFTHEKQSSRKLINSEFFTMDNKTKRKKILLTHEGEEMNLEGAKVIFAFDFTACGTTMVLDSESDSVSIEDSYVSIILPDGVKYTGMVLMYTYVEFPDGSSLDAGYAIRTEFTESFLDTELEEMERFYVSRFEDLARQVEEMLANMEELIYNTVRDLTDAVVGEMIEEKMQPILETIVEDILEQVMAGDIVTEAQMNTAITAAIEGIDFPEGMTEEEVQRLIDAAIATIDFTVNWNDIQGRPATFPPSAHNHPWNQITGVPATFPPSAHTHTWDSITGRPATFPAAPHNHGMNEITGLNNELQSIRNSIPAPCTCDNGGGSGGGDCSCPPLTWANIQNVPSTFPAAPHNHPMSDITGLTTEIQRLENLIPSPCNCDNGGGSGGNCSCPSFPLNLQNLNWQSGSMNGHVAFTGGNVGLNWGQNQAGATPDAGGLHECGIQARSTSTSLLIRASGRLDTLNRAFFFRPNNANSPTPDDMILFNDGRLNARVYSEDGVLLEDKYLPQDGFMDALLEKQIIPQNSLANSAPPSAYPMGISFYTTTDNTLGFPHASLSIRTYRFPNGRIIQEASTIVGVTHLRYGATEGWIGGGGGTWVLDDNQDRIDEITEKLNGHSIWSGTQAQYDALPSINPSTLYFIV